jgi:hypothetical protein
MFKKLTAVCIEERNTISKEKQPLAGCLEEVLIEFAGIDWQTGLRRYQKTGRSFVGSGFKESIERQFPQKIQDYSGSEELLIHSDKARSTRSGTNEALDLSWKSISGQRAVHLFDSVENHLFSLSVRLHGLEELTSHVLS